MPPLPKLTPVPPQPQPQPGPLPSLPQSGPPTVVRIPLFGNNAALVGTVPASLPSVLMQTGFLSVSYTAGVNGFGINFPVPFPNGLLSLFYTVEAGSTHTSAGWVIAGCSRTKHQFIILAGTAEAASGNYNLTYVALGW